MRKIKIAQIGTSRMSHGNDIFKTLKKLSDVYEIVGYALPEDEHEIVPDILGVFDGYPELTVEQILSDPEIDAVAVETEEIYLTKYAKMVAESGKHLHMEKPGGTDPVAFTEMIDAVKRGGKVFHTGYMYRYNVEVQKLLERIRNGELGDILYVQAQMNCTHSKDTREWLGKFPGGMMFFLGCHLVDLIYTIQGEPKQVIPLNQDTHLDNVDSYDFGMAALIYDTGVSFAQAADVEPGGFSRRQLVVVGTKATVEIHPLEEYVEGGRLISRVKISGASLNWGLPSEKYEAEPQDRYINMMLSFAEMVRGEKKNPYTPDYEHALYRLVLRCCGVEL